ncbi:hypothetical protein BH20ACT4_BH20ACT4_04450 [soil metagenome]
MLLKCSDEVLDDRVIVTVAGAIDLSTVAALRDHLLRVVTDNPGGTVVIDLDEVVAVDDTGLGILLGLAGRAREHGGDLRLVCAPGRLRDRLSLTGADRAVDVSSKRASID